MLISDYLATIETQYNRLINWMKRFNFLVLLLIYEIITILVGGFVMIFETNHYSPLKEYSLSLQILYGILIMPFLETWFFHNYLIKLVAKKTSFNSVAVIISAIFFGLMHGYSNGYIVVTFFGGIILATYYFVFDAQKRNPLIYVFLIHAINNLLSILESTFF